MSPVPSKAFSLKVRSGTTSYRDRNGREKELCVAGCLLVRFQQQVGAALSLGGGLPCRKRAWLV